MKGLTLLLLLAISTSALFAGGDEKKDTVRALVVSTGSFESKLQVNRLNGNQIIQLIDSLLSLDEIPVGLVNEINEYAANKMLKEDIYISLTGFYDSSIYPSQSMYKKWDTYNLYPYNELLRKNDNEVKLIIKDDKNFCHFVPPIKGLITSYFGWRDGKSHNGLDIDLQVWDPVVASFDGMVRVARYHPGYGRVVIIRHYNGLETLYAHLHRLKVKPGEIVEAGQVVGLGGSSGKSTGSHLHFELRFKGKALNPKHIIDFNNNCLISDSIKLVKTKWSYQPVPLGITYHTVKKGDYLYKIANQYGISITRLCQYNGIRRNSLLRVGQKLRVGS